MLYLKKDKKRFFAKVDKRCSAPCWKWTAAKSIRGYGAISFGRNNTKKAHRVSYMYYKGDIPKGGVVRHTCNNTWCVNPKHLVLGTQKDNGLDRKKSGITAGRNHYKAKKRKFRIWNDRTLENYEFDYQFEAAEFLDMNSATIYRLLKSEGTKTKDGHQAKYIDTE